MFRSFFPQPKLFFISAAIWSLAGIFLWQFGAKNWGVLIGMPNIQEGTPPLIGAEVLITAPHMYFFVYFASIATAFVLFWRFFSSHPWFNWSVSGSAFIIFVTYFQVQISVAINDWYGVYFDLIQKALSPATKGSVALSELYSGIVDLTGLLAVWILVGIFLTFFTSHYTFRWRTAMNDFYVANWQELRLVEGASQRVQEDTKRFAQLVERLGASFVSAVMTLIAFLPVLAVLSSSIKSVPLLGEIPYSLVIVSIIWALFGTGLLALIGIKLPGLEFKNQRVEAAFRKELVFGEDSEHRAKPQTLRELFSDVRKNYFVLYANYLYFNFGSYLYLQADSIVPFLVTAPAIAAGAITFGIFQQIRSAMGEVRDAMQYLVKSWPDIVELISIQKRLRAFEAVIDNEPLPDIDKQWLEEQGIT
jgi:peptide/bleomycin uptake transporter